MSFFAFCSDASSLVFKAFAGHKSHHVLIFKRRGGASDTHADGNCGLSQTYTSSEG